MNRATQRSLDNVFYWFSEILLNVKRNSSNVMLVGEVGMLSPSSLCHRNTLLYFIRLNNLPSDSVVKYVFLESKRLCKFGHRNWHTKVWELVQSYNLNIDSLYDSNATKHLIKSTVMAEYVSDWHAKLQNINYNPILRTSKMFRKEFKWECYSNGVKNSKYLKAFTKCRTTSHTLEFKRGRYTNPSTPL